MKKILTISLIGATLLLSGCGSDSEGEQRLETQQSLDKADYQKVISNLETKASTKEDYLALAAAYMGKAGLSLSDLIAVVGDSGNNEDAFGSFVTSIDDATKDSLTPLLDLTKATDYYELVVSANDCKESTTLTDAEKDVCIYKGLSQAMGVATSMSYIANDISAVFDTTSSDSSDTKLTASTCAMQYSFDPESVTDCTVTPKGDITFASGITYSDIDVEVDGDTYEYLLTQTTPSSTTLTKDYCTTENFTREATKLNDSYHVCPIVEDANQTEITTSSVIVDALNNGLDAISVNADDDLQSDVDDFKQEILDSSGKTADDTITEDDVINYLNDNN
jgi:hypothetical protein